MSWFYLYRTADGSLLSEASSLPQSLPDGVSYLEETERKSQTQTWDATLPGWVAGVSSRRITLDELFSRLTESEQASYYGLSSDDADAKAIDAAIARNRALADGRLNLDSPVVAALLDRLVNLGVITANRKTEILA